MYACVSLCVPIPGQEENLSWGACHYESITKDSDYLIFSIFQLPLTLPSPPNFVESWEVKIYDTTV